MNLFCVKVRAGWVDRTGVGHTLWWAGSYEVTPPAVKGWVGSTGHYQDNPLPGVSRFVGSGPTLISCCCG